LSYKISSTNGSYFLYSQILILTNKFQFQKLPQAASGDPSKKDKKVLLVELIVQVITIKQSRENENEHYS